MDWTKCQLCFYMERSKANNQEVTLYFMNSDCLGLLLVPKKTRQLFKNIK